MYRLYKKIYKCEILIKKNGYAEIVDIINPNISERILAPKLHLIYKER